MNYTISFQERIENLYNTKMRQTKEKQEINGTDGYWDMDDRGIIPPPLDFKFEPLSNHTDGDFYGNLLCGKNYRRLLETHPVHIDPMSSLAGGWMYNFYNIKKAKWNPDYSYEYLHELQRKYDLVHGIGGVQHFNVDYKMGLELGFTGILKKIEKYEKINSSDKADFYNAEKDVLLGIMNIIKRHAYKAHELAETETNYALKESLIKMARTNENLTVKPPETFLEACQFIAWFVMIAAMYNSSGAGGAIDKYLKPYYDKDIKSGILTKEEAVFHLACLLLKDNQYYEIGGTYTDGTDRTNEISYCMIEAAHRLKIPTNICLRVHENIDKDFLYLAVKYLFEDKLGTPSFLGDKAINRGAVNNGFSIELARQREKTGCHWCSLPGMEYTLNDIVKINFLAVFNVAFKEVIADKTTNPTIEVLWNSFVKHLSIAIKTIAEGIDFHLEHMHKVFPELVLNLLCHGTIEEGLDASNGGVEYYNLCVDGAGLATIADSFAAIEQRVETEQKLTWEQLATAIETDFAYSENTRLLLHSAKKYGSGNSPADEYAVKITQIFTNLVKQKTTPNGKTMVPGLFSWANTIPFGKAVGASPNGRHAYHPISHGANPDTGNSNKSTPTSMARAVASVQCGYGNTSPLQLEFDPNIAVSHSGIVLIISFINSFCDIGGTLLNINILNKEKILAAHENPDLYPDLVVRVTGFSAYFASLSREFRQLVVDRITEG